VDYTNFYELFLSGPKHKRKAREMKRAKIRPSLILTCSKVMGVLQ
jgi:hypothetical protein